MTDITLQNKFSSLPEDLKTQVIDFIDFLLQKNTKEQPNSESTPPYKSTEEKVLRLEDFNFVKSRKILQNVKGSLSDIVIEERRSE